MGAYGYTAVDLREWDKTGVDPHDRRKEMGEKTLEQFRKMFPSIQTMHNGKWGWRRIGGCLNLNAARFATREEAEQDRDSHYGKWLEHPEDYSR